MCLADILFFSFSFLLWLCSYAHSTVFNAEWGKSLLWSLGELALIRELSTTCVQVFWLTGDCYSTVSIYRNYLVHFAHSNAFLTRFRNEGNRVRLFFFSFLALVILYARAFLNVRNVFFFSFWREKERVWTMRTIIRWFRERARAQ